MKSLEISGKNVEEAIQHALEKLGVTRNEVEVTVLNEGKTGILGVGAEPAKIRVRPLVTMPENESNVVEAAKGVLEALLTQMGIVASVVFEETLPAEGEEGATAPITLDIKGDDLGILIGRRGQTLSCLQYIVRLIVTHQMRTWTPIVVDVEGYKVRRHEALQALALRVAERVKVKEASFTLEPMPPYERRIIHLTLADHPDVTTQSTGVGESRKVIILPKKQ